MLWYCPFLVTNTMKGLALQNKQHVTSKFERIMPRVDDDHIRLTVSLPTTNRLALPGWKRIVNEWTASCWRTSKGEGTTSETVALWTSLIRPPSDMPEKEKMGMNKHTFKHKKMNINTTFQIPFFQQNFILSFCEKWLKKTWRGRSKRALEEVCCWARIHKTT